MLQWIAGLEKAAATSHFVESNRFDSFAPIRMNVSAQWLVDGVSSLSVLVRAFGFILSSETTSGIYHVRSCSRKIRFISMIGGSRPVSVNQPSRIVFVVGLTWSRALLAQARYA